MAGGINGGGRRPPDKNGPVRPGAPGSTSLPQGAMPGQRPRAQLGATRPAGPQKARGADARRATTSAEPLSAPARQQLEEFGHDGQASEALRHATQGAASRHLADPRALNDEVLHHIAHDPAGATPVLPPPPAHIMPISGARAEHFVANQSLGKLEAASFAELPPQMRASLHGIAAGSVVTEPFDKETKRDLKRLLVKTSRDKTVLERFFAVWDAVAMGWPAAARSRATGASPVADAQATSPGRLRDKVTKSFVGLGQAGAALPMGAGAITGGAGLAGAFAMTSMPTPPSAPDTSYDSNAAFEAARHSDEEDENDPVQKALLARLALAANAPIDVDGGGADSAATGSADAGGSGGAAKATGAAAASSSPPGAGAPPGTVAESMVGAFNAAQVAVGSQQFLSVAESSPQMPAGADLPGFTMPQVSSSVVLNQSWDAFVAQFQNKAADMAAFQLLVRGREQALVAATAVLARQLAVFQQTQSAMVQQLDSLTDLFGSILVAREAMKNINGVNHDVGQKRTDDQQELDIFPKFVQGDARARSHEFNKMASAIDRVHASAQAGGIDPLSHLNRAAPPAGAGGGAAAPAPNALAHATTMLSDSEIELVRRRDPALGAELKATKQELVHHYENAVGNLFNVATREADLRGSLLASKTAALAAQRNPAARAALQQEIDALRSAHDELRGLAHQRLALYSEVARTAKREDSWFGNLKRLTHLHESIAPLAQSWSLQRAGQPLPPELMAKTGRFEHHGMRIALEDHLDQALAVQAPLMLNANSNIDTRTARHHSGKESFRARVHALWDAELSSEVRSAGERMLHETMVKEVRMASTVSSFAAASLSYRYQALQQKVTAAFADEPLSIRHRLIEQAMRGPVPRIETPEEFARHGQKFVGFLDQTIKAQMTRHIFDQFAKNDRPQLSLEKIAQDRHRETDPSKLNTLRLAEERHFWEHKSGWEGHAAPAASVAILRALRDHEPQEVAHKRAYLESIGLNTADDAGRAHALQQLASEQHAGVSAMSPDERVDHKLKLYQARRDVLNQDVMTDRTYQRLEVAQQVTNASVQSFRGIYTTASDNLMGAIGDVAQTLDQSFSELLGSLGSMVGNINSMNQRLAETAFEIAH